MTTEEEKMKKKAEVELAFSGYGLTDRQIEVYATRVITGSIGSLAKLHDRFVDYLELWQKLGLSYDKALDFARNHTPYLGDYYRITASFIKVLGAQDTVTANPIQIKLSPNRLHALMMHGKETGERIPNNLLYNGNYHGKIKSILEQAKEMFPLSQEVVQVVCHLARLTPTELKSKYGITNEELSEIYPSSKEELVMLTKIARMSDEEIEGRYGISRKELVRTYPLDSQALRSIETSNVKSRLSKMSDEDVYKFYKVTKENLMGRETIGIDNLTGIVRLGGMTSSEVEETLGVSKEEALLDESLTVQRIETAVAKTGTPRRIVAQELYKRMKEGKK